MNYNYFEDYIMNLLTSERGGKTYFNFSDPYILENCSEEYRYILENTPSDELTDEDIIWILDKATELDWEKVDETTYKTKSLSEGIKFPVIMGGTFYGWSCPPTITKSFVIYPPDTPNKNTFSTKNLKGFYTGIESPRYRNPKLSLKDLKLLFHWSKRGIFVLRKKLM